MFFPSSPNFYSEAINLTSKAISNYKFRKSLVFWSWLPISHFLNWHHNLCKEAWHENTASEECSKSTLVPIPKKGDLSLKSKQGLEKTQEKKVFNCFIDFQKAFDTIKHRIKWATLKSYDVEDLWKCLVICASRQREWRVVLNGLRKERRRSFVTTPLHRISRSSNEPGEAEHLWCQHRRNINKQLEICWWHRSLRWRY